MICERGDGITGSEVLLRTLVRFDVQDDFHSETLFPCVYTIHLDHGKEEHRGAVFSLYYTAKSIRGKKYRRMPLGHNACWNIEDVLYEHIETRQSVIASLSAMHAAPNSYLSTNFMATAPDSKLCGCSLGLSVAACVLGLPNFAYTGWITPYSMDPSDLAVGAVKGIGAKMKYCKENRIPFFVASEALQAYKKEIYASSNGRQNADPDDVEFLDKSDFNRFYNIDSYWRGVPFRFSVFEAVECNNLVEVILMALAIANQLAQE